MHYLDKVKNTRDFRADLNNKSKYIDLFIDKLRESGVLKIEHDTKELKAVLNKVVKALEKDDTRLLNALEKLANKETVVNYTPPNVIVPEIKVPEIKAPKVTIPKIDAPNIDTTGIENAIKEAMEREEPLDLDNYQAHDIMEQEGYQYIGFLNPEGSWYIIQNNVKDNSLRYVFGAKDYSKKFKKANLYVYKTLDEAVNEIRS